MASWVVRSVATLSLARQAIRVNPSPTTGSALSPCHSILIQFAATLEEHQEGVLNYYHYPISTGPLEGTNNKIQLMKRQAYGFRDKEFLKLKILGIHESKYALLG